MSITHVDHVADIMGKNIDSLFLVYVCKKQAIIFVFNFEKKMLI